MTRRRWLLLLFLLLIAACVRIEVVEIARAPRVVVDRVVSNIGSGTTCNDATPCHPAYAMSQSLPGDFITALDGVYTGPNYMMAPPIGRNGAAGQPITFRARNDGKVRFDGQVARIPCVLNGVDYWTVTGFDCAYTNDTNFYVKNSNHITAQRICAWDVPDSGNLQNALIQDSSNVLIEDSCFFGIATQAFEEFGGSSGSLGPNTYRRLWLRTEGSHGSGGPGNPVQWNYTSANHPYPSLAENIISVSCSNRAPCDYGTNWLRHNTLSPYFRFYGYIDYYNGLGSMGNGSVSNTGAYTGYLIQDAIAHANGANLAPFFFQDGSGSGEGIQQKLVTRITSIRGGARTSSYSDITVSPPGSNIEATSVAGTGFDYTGTGNTARLCFRYQNGIYTSTPLWPWPMDDRIKAAIAVNASRGSPALVGSAGSGYAPGTPTSEIASLFGPIPAACNSTGTTFVPSFPVVTDFPSVACCLDDFNRANGAVGSNWTTVAGAGFNIAGNLAVPNSPAPRALWNPSAFSGAHEVYKTVPTVPADGTGTVLLIFGATTLTDSGYHLILSRNASANDTITIARITGGYAEIFGPIDLGGDVVNGNSFGVRVSPAQNISVYWKYNATWYRIGTVIDTNIPQTNNIRIGMGGTTGETGEDFGGGTCCGGAITPANIGRFGSRFPTP